MKKYTGHVDQNDVKLYEDDLVEYYGNVMIVQFSDESKKYALFDKNGNEFMNKGWNLCIKIGTLEDNPELLDEDSIV